MTTTQPRDVYEIDTEHIIRGHEGAFAYEVICDLRDRLRECADAQERRAVCKLWRDLYKGEKR